MNELIARLQSGSEDVEILFNNLIHGSIIEKKVSLKKFIELLRPTVEKANADNNLKPVYLGESTIGYTEDKSAEIYVIKQPKRKRIVNFSGKAYNINFPNAIYIVYIRTSLITKIIAFSYLEWNGESTELFEYPLPNMLSGNSLCIGTGEKRVEGNIEEALDRIIEDAQYTHSIVSNIKGFSSTSSQFEFMEKEELDKKYLMPAKKKVKDLFK